VAFSLYIYLKASFHDMISPLNISLLSLTECFPSIIIILLWILAHSASIAFTVLKRRMKKSLAEDKTIKLNELRTWKLHHGLICNLIKRINSCFGIVNLLIMIHTFITFIYNVYQFVACLKDCNISPYFYFYKFIIQAALPCYLIFSCSQLKEQVLIH